MQHSEQWHIIDGSTIEKSGTLEADVVIIGSGAGGGVSAQILAEAGFKVILIEEGPFKTAKDFDMTEATAYPSLYQESANRKTHDKSISILQGRAVGGSTTVNWTTSFRTPKNTLKHWESHHQVKDLSEESLKPWFQKMEHALSISRWRIPPNANNAMLALGAERLGITFDTIRRNVKNCWNLGYCGVGCPINAKQSMLVTTIPAALNHNTTLIHHMRAKNFVFKNEKIVALECQPMQPGGVFSKPLTYQVKGKHFILSAGSIGTPALLLRSNAPDPYNLVGKRTFLHPTLISSAIFKQDINAYQGAPQVIYSDHFLWRDGVSGALGYKLEVPPIHPVIVSTLLPFHGQKHFGIMKYFNRLQTTIALGRDGFHDDSRGGEVQLKNDGSPSLKYPITDYLWSGFQHALLTMAELQFAAGAKTVIPLHSDAKLYRSWHQAKQAIKQLPLQKLRLLIASAHVMGGCPMGEDDTISVVNSMGQHHHIENLSIFDGSIFPTSIAANPQLSIYAIIARNATKLSQQLTAL